MVYEALLRSSGLSSDSFCNAAFCATAAGLPKRAVELCELGLASSPNGGALWVNLGNALMSLGRSVDAKEAFTSAVSSEPRNMRFVYNLASCHLGLKEFAEARRLFFLALESGYAPPELLNNLAICLSELGELNLALSFVDRALTVNPYLFDPLISRGQIYMKLGDFTCAERDFCHASRIQPSSPVAFFNLGNALRANLRAAEALGAYDQAISLLSPHDRRTIDSLRESFSTLPAAHPLDILEDKLDSVALASSLGDLLNNRAVVLNELRQFESARVDSLLGLLSDLRCSESWNTLGVALYNLCHPRDAIWCFKRAIDLDSSYVDPFLNLGNAYIDIGDFPNALRAYDSVLRIDEGNAKALLNKGFAYLKLGEFTQGFKLYESRWRADPISHLDRSYPQPRWDGSFSIAGQKLFVWSEQGLGDVIQFCRFLPILCDLGIHLFFEARTELLSILGTLDGRIKLVPRGEPLPEFDAHCPLMSLPHILQITINSIPTSVPYLRVDERIRETWRRVVDSKSSGGVKVGIAWSSVSGFRSDFRRSMALEQFSRCLPRGGGRLILPSETSLPLGCHCC